MFTYIFLQALKQVQINEKHIKIRSLILYTLPFTILVYYTQIVKKPKNIDIDMPIAYTQKLFI